ncbi:Nuclear transport factor 2 family protein with rna binding domain isoform [Thalictrum thalictroides]|uniref:Nuclear transport factor 2 family protein with rna binding domain isoform n=1 Tax=Thalictrum thalictroides TaxID=46969 RepID=A0A7J6VQQ0_THATH|nr:Nuclear transport factor 2 family protein with rna binding domain isoform [Thalictrum thalictroides]
MASPVEVAGTRIYIEERRPRSSSISRGRGRGRGRGGYSTDASKGRFGTRNFGRGNADGADRDYSRSRGNGYHRRGATQDRGILGNHVSRNEQYPSDDAAY